MKEPRKLLLVRHSTVQMDPNIPSSQWRLSAVGRERSRDLAVQVGQHHPALFVTSTEPKSMETGQILAASLGVPWETAENLHEHDRSGTPFLGSREAFEAAVTDFFVRPQDELVFGRETAAQACIRFDSAVRNVLATHVDDTIAIVTHGTVLTLFLSHYNPDLDPLAFWRRLSLPCFFEVSLSNFTLEDRRP